MYEFNYDCQLGDKNKDMSIRGSLSIRTYTQLPSISIISFHLSPTRIA